ncbi:hypothetical protein ABZ723_09060 [Streptomyces sp. NPDC006700]|uniref:hypothetical protein n=1 Tax=unclassified Streptomyces TaxID=2593676 RepID=UPI003406AD66
MNARKRASPRSGAASAAARIITDLRAAQLPSPSDPHQFWIANLAAPFPLIAVVARRTQRASSAPSPSSAGKHKELPRFEADSAVRFFARHFGRAVTSRA